MTCHLEIRMAKWIENQDDWTNTEESWWSGRGGNKNDGG